MSEGLRDAMVRFCRAVSETQREGLSPEVEFFWDNGMTAAFQIVKVPTLRVSVGSEFVITADHEGVRKP